MKKKFSVLLMMCPILLCTGCSFLSLASLSDQTIGVYSLLDETKNGQAIDNCLVGTLHYKVKEGEDYLPYLSLKEYGELIRPYLKDGYGFYTAEDTYSSLWAVSDSNGDYIFAVEINPKNKSIWCRGSLSSALSVGKDYSNSSLDVQMSIKAEVMRESTKEGESYYGNTSYKVYKRNGVAYYPLSLLESAISESTGIYHIYNYHRILEYDEYEKLNEFKYIVNNKQATAFSEMKFGVDYAFFNTMPNYLIEDRANAFFFIMDNYYGLAQTRKIGSMVNYYKGQNYYNYFFSSNTDDRNNALYAAIGLLDDGHTAMDEVETAPWFTQNYSYGGSHLQNMIAVRNNLKTSRGNFYTSQNKEVGDVLYSSSGKLAFFSFDSFVFEEDAFNGESLKPDLYKTDTYFQFVNNFNNIKARGGVKTIVLDISINGGGVLGIMMKLLALLSKDNASPIYIMEDSTMMVEKEITSVDSNGDNEYNANDCYGNSFNFAILTSGYSFSCGNAFPYYASKCNYAKIIGQVSAGGECTVSESMLPSGEHFYHSSNLHMGYFDEVKRIWSGDESGAPVDYQIDYANFYNLDYLDQLLN